MKIRNLTKSFKNKDSLALDDVSMEIQKGSIHGLLGNNGAGKTTLIKCIVNLLIPDSGEIIYNEKNILKDKKTRINNISVLLDGGRNLYLYMTVQENIKYFTMLHGISDYKKMAKYDLLVKHLELEDILHKRVSSLSFGMRQRAAIASALMCNVEFLILDQPTTGLDIHYQDKLSKLLVDLQEQFDITILLSSHDMNFINKTCNYCTLLSDGEMIKTGKIEEFLEVFDNNNYTLYYKNEITEEMVGSLEKEFDVINFNLEDKMINILWEKEGNIVEIFNKFEKNNIFIVDIKKTNDLTHSILMLTGEEK